MSINQGWAEPTWRDTVEVGRKPVSRSNAWLNLLRGEDEEALLCFASLSLVFLVRFFLPPRTPTVLPASPPPIFRYQSTIIGIMPRIIAGTSLISRGFDVCLSRRNEVLKSRPSANYYFRVFCNKISECRKLFKSTACSGNLGTKAW